MNRGRHSAGFTLAEMIIVVVVVAMIAGLVAPRMGAMFPDRQVRGAAEQLAAVFRRVRQEALMTVRRHYIDLQNAQYIVYVEEDPLGMPGEYSQASGTLGGVFLLPETVRIESSGPLRVMFQPDGSMDDATVTLVHEAGLRRTVTAGGRRGEVTIE